MFIIKKLKLKLKEEEEEEEGESLQLICKEVRANHSIFIPRADAKP